jgi:hypothetical protein
MKSLILALACLALCREGIAQSGSFTIRKGGNCFVMDIPEYLTRTFSLNDVASLQYQDTSISAYVIVIEDNKEHLQEVGIRFAHPKDFLENFTTDFKKDRENRRLTPVTEFSSNGYGHAQTEMRWTEAGADFYMLITSVETPGHFYKIMCWTTGQNIGKVDADFRRISRSLKE